MNLTILPYSYKTKPYILVIVTAIASFIVILFGYLDIKNTDCIENEFMWQLLIINRILALLIMWLFPIIVLLGYWTSRKMKVTITDDEIICQNTARFTPKSIGNKLIPGKCMKYLSIKRKDIVNKRLQLGFRGPDYLEITTKDYSYSVVVVDPNAINLALEGAYQEAEALIEKKCKKQRVIWLVLTIIVDILFGLVGCFMFK